MYTLSYRIGYWSAISLAGCFIIWIVSFAGIALTSGMFYWTDLSGYIESLQSNNRFFQNLAFLFMLLAGPVYLLLLNGYHSYAVENKKVWARIGLQFALAFAILSSMHYFMQLSSVRLNLIKGNFQVIEPFLQANPLSVTNSTVMLGWTLFLGLSSFFMSAVFEKKGPDKLLRRSFLINGISCILAAVGYIFQIDAVTFVFANMVTGGMLIIISVASARLFRREIRVMEIS